MNKICGLVTCIVLMISNAHAFEPGIGVKAGTLGAGIDLSVALTRTINARVSVTRVEIDDQTETITIGDAGFEGDLNTTMNFDFGSSSLLFDWYVFNGTFHLTAGMLKNNGDITFSGTLPNGVTVTLDGQTVDATDITGNISGSISAGESYQPYLGFGWGRKAGKNAGISLSIEIGVALLDPSAELNATVNIGGNNTLTQADLDASIAAAEDDINAELDILKAWPVISIGFNYAF